MDATRPVIAACHEPSPNNHLFRSNSLDIIGYNYHHQNYADVPMNFPGKPFLATETVSGLMTRGYYRMPSDQKYIWPLKGGNVSKKKGKLMKMLIISVRLMIIVTFLGVRTMRILCV